MTAHRRLDVSCHYERELLKTPLGFKGNHLRELWQVAACMRNADEQEGIGLGVQSVLWSDAQVSTSRSEATANSEMLLTTRFALQQARQIDWNHPIELLEQILSPTYDFAKHLTGRSDLRLTYALNALVPVDHAAWLLYCRERNLTDFDVMIPDEMLAALPFRQEKLASIPLIAYDVPIEEVARQVNEGASVLKIKIGSDPDKDGDLDKMIEWDKQRLAAIHARVRDQESLFTENSRIAYYLDANGRYDSRDRLLRLLDHADHIGALDRIILVEEPFEEKDKQPVEDLPVRLAADESAHTDRDVRERIDLGYGAIALKPIAKTLSMSLRIAKVAHEWNIPCFCADLTANPVLVDWNKNMAARLGPLPGMKIGLLEVNGHQNYRNWDRMVSYHPCAGANWMKTAGGCFTLDEGFYRRSGGIFEISPHYKELAGTGDSSSTGEERRDT